MNDPVCWIESSDDGEASHELRAQFDAVRNDRGELDNLYRAFSLRGHMMQPADDLYRAVLHHDSNTIAKRDSELYGCYVAILTECDYAVAHHGDNFRQLDANLDTSERILNALRADRLNECGDVRTVAALRFIKLLTTKPERMGSENISELRTNGWNDGEILELVQIVAMFSYFVRVINGLGISLSGETIGLY